MTRETETALENLVRIGTVTWTDPVKRVARVKFQDTELPSGLLHVLANRSYIPDYEIPQHPPVIKPWMPKVNAIVLCLYLPVWNGDGFILGEIGELEDLMQWADQ